MSKTLFKGTTNGLALWVDVQALEKLRQERNAKRERRLGQDGLKDLGAMRMRPLEQTIQIMLDKLSVRNGCWEWPERPRFHNYGTITVLGRDGKKWQTHRLFFFLINNYLPDQVCHHCDNPPCCRPDHLFAGNHQVNCDDKIKKGRARYAVGEAVATAKLTPDQVWEIRRRLRRGSKRGNSARALAREFGMGKTTILQVADGKSWKHLAQPA